MVSLAGPGSLPPGKAGACNAFVGWPRPTALCTGRSLKPYCLAKASAAVAPPPVHHWSVARQRRAHQHVLPAACLSVSARLSVLFFPWAQCAQRDTCPCKQSCIARYQAPPGAGSCWLAALLAAPTSLHTPARTVWLCPLLPLASHLRRFRASTS